MTLLLTILSVLALWALLALLFFGLLLLLKPLESVRRNLEQITMGVRAIEHETLPLGVQAEALQDSLGETGQSIDATAGHLTSAARSLEAIAPKLRRP